jgi:hypothetical protein
VAVARVELAVVVSGMADTGPRSADALSMPGFRPAARPAVGGRGGENGCAGGTKLVTPGAAGIGEATGAGRGVNNCAAGDSATAGLGATGGASTDAAGGAANIPTEDCPGASG